MSLRLGLELGADAIEEGKDVYFECKIQANPDVYKISWTHNVSNILFLLQASNFVSPGKADRREKFWRGVWSNYQWKKFGFTGC